MNSPTHFVNTGAMAMAKAVEERTKGEVRIEVYPSGQLGENAQITEQISLGGELIGQVGVGTLADFVPDYSIIFYPFLYPAFPPARKFLNTDLVKSGKKERKSS